ncbi:hypothetical protein B0J13DRAFT_311184 [Dactylonectria estremocensis]|uniref:Uncharacterized protein n=1 Tax=Dactylonectria estremocensis TaxID=1079267 RepID=A0A9P9JB26_9HYPO|nr:hypothetical protein B0J13DRAFT_311184 [Dactylonectria estremocensis]
MASLPVRRLAVHRSCLIGLGEWERSLKTTGGWVRISLRSVVFSPANRRTGGLRFGHWSIFRALDAWPHCYVVTGLGQVSAFREQATAPNSKGSKFMTSSGRAAGRFFHGTSTESRLCWGLPMAIEQSIMAYWLCNQPNLDGADANIRFWT